MLLYVCYLNELFPSFDRVLVLFFCEKSDCPDILELHHFTIRLICFEEANALFTTLLE